MARLLVIGGAGSWVEPATLLKALSHWDFTCLRILKYDSAGLHCK